MCLKCLHFHGSLNFLPLQGTLWYKWLWKAFKGAICLGSTFNKSEANKRHWSTSGSYCRDDASFWQCTKGTFVLHHFSPIWWKQLGQDFVWGYDLSSWSQQWSFHLGGKNLQRFVLLKFINWSVLSIQGKHESIDDNICSMFVEFTKIVFFCRTVLRIALCTFSACIIFFLPKKYCLLFWNSGWHLLQGYKCQLET